MTQTPILLPEAKADVADGYQWYEEQSLGFGMEFLRCVETALRAIGQVLTGLDAAAVRPYLQRLLTDALATPEGPDGGMRYRATRREP